MPKILILLALLLLPIAVPAAPAPDPPPPPPWQEAGLDVHQAAAHLLDRFAFGPRPGDVDHVVEMGLEAWFESQLHSALPDAGLSARLRPLDLFTLDAEALAAAFPGRAAFLRQAMAADLLPEGMGADPRAALQALPPDERRALRSDLQELALEIGVRRPDELEAQLTAHKLIAAVHAENQLREVMADFWFNHFNVSARKPEVRPFLLSYERDALRPHVLGEFRDLLGATARHPAMLAFLDNARSTAEADATTLLEHRQRTATSRRSAARGGRAFAVRGSVGGVRVRRGAGGAGSRRRSAVPAPPRRGSTGLNENYARELLELHTLGVDGGYDQADVVAVARAFTGWTVVPPAAGDDIDRRQALAGDRFGRLGFVREGLFLFRADTHDAGAKRVLGRKLAAGRGLEDGEEILDLLAVHPSTAHHLAGKLAVRFVQDDPPPALVDRLAASFTASGGDVAAVLRTLFHSPELWAPEARAAKVKSPFELAASALRAVDAEVVDAADTVRWIAAMGQPLYAQDSPAGYPDRAEAWVGTGTLLARMSFASELAAGRVDGVDAPALEAGWTGAAGAGAGEDAGVAEPESVEATLHRIVRHLLPGRDPQPTVAALTPLAVADGQEMGLAWSVGLVLGSPEFQRR